MKARLCIETITKLPILPRFDQKGQCYLQMREMDYNVGEDKEEQRER